ncbi:hypothetical protein [Sedimenticola hydrogenitrophicus]|uniref:hypothetical protein n=1 Tax=Sedimenticola hydrogenitrophicus TaxID=2967975 RepID=UPI0023B0D320|nr:hypothetical protein [Sedimenticola hydrogenitrophicus]
MSADEPITLQVSAHQIERFCAELRRGSANTNRKHSALIALEGFIIRHAATDKYTSAFNNIVNIIQGHAEQTRQALLNEYAENLEPALKNRDRNALAAIHQSVSRNGFDQLLEQVLVRLSPELLHSLKLWAEKWVNEAESKARRASGYPDALNFKQAGIPLDQYRALSELKRKLTPL